jgi:hypothetical protein
MCVIALHHNFRKVDQACRLRREGQQTEGLTGTSRHGSAS